MKGKEKSGDVATRYWAMLIFVVIFWGIDPLINAYFYSYYSASVLSTVLTFSAATFFLLLSIPKWKQLNRDYLRIAVPICTVNAIACLLQRIGLQYTTPANYAFLEHLACVAVPVMTFVFVRRRPKWTEILSCGICLAGCFLLAGMSFSGAGLRVGDLLCAMAGLLYGGCAAAIGAFAQKLDITLYMMIHTSAYFAVSLILAITLNGITVGGVPMEPAVFTAEPWLLVIVALFGLVDIALCWLCRTEAVKHIGPIPVSVMMAFCAVITGTVSVAFGRDRLTPRLVLGGGLVLLALLLPMIVDAFRRRKNEMAVEQEKLEENT